MSRRIEKITREINRLSSLSNALICERTGRRDSYSIFLAREGLKLVEIDVRMTFKIPVVRSFKVVDLSDKVYLATFEKRTRPCLDKGIAELIAANFNPTFAILDAGNVALKGLDLGLPIKSRLMGLMARIFALLRMRIYLIIRLLSLR